jgi:hypothetical protein
MEQIVYRVVVSYFEFEIMCKDTEFTFEKRNITVILYF